MKKFSLLSGAYVNAGDFLIVDRAKKLLKDSFPDCEITEYRRDEKLEKYLYKINDTDALIIAGGPAYMLNVYPDIIPLVENLDDIKTKIFTIGLGWYGKSVDERYINNYIFTPRTKQLFERISKDAGVLSCRDWYTVKVLNKNGFDNAILTGCPAWYNLEKKNSCNIREDLNYNFKKICISDPANEVNIKESLIVARFIKNKFPSSEIHFVFHRIDYDNIARLQAVINQLKKMNIIIDDISGGLDGIKVYDNCDLHIGYRVHAHIYNVSNRNISILIEEDGRGTGVNQALGTLGIKAYNSHKISGHSDSYIEKLNRKIKTHFILSLKYSNKYLEKDINDCLNIIKKNNYSQFITALNCLKYYHEVMENYIKNV